MPCSLSPLLYPNSQIVTTLVQVSVVSPLSSCSHLLSGLPAFCPTSHHHPFASVDRVTHLNHKSAHVMPLLAIL